MNYYKAKYLLLLFILIYAIAAIVALADKPQGMVFDPGMALKMTDNTAKHIPFNYYAHPNPQNISQDQLEFVTWWSPGQFVLPGAIQKCLGVNLGTAIKILIGLCLLISGGGIYRLFEILLDEERKPTALSFLLLIFTIFQPFFWANITAYDGGGILLLAYCPWFIYWVVKYGRINVQGIIILFLFGCIGFFLKIAFTSIFAGALCYLFLVRSFNFQPGDLKITRKVIANALCLCGVFAAYILAGKVLFLAYNANISTSVAGLRWQPRVVVFPIVAPLFGLFNLYYLDRTYHWIAGCVVVIPIYYFLLKSRLVTIKYKFILVGFVGTGLLFYMLVYLLNYDVSYQLRHYIILTVILTPAVWLAFRGHKILKIALLLLAGLYTLLNAYDYTMYIKNQQTIPVTSEVTGLSQDVSNDLLKNLHQLDNADTTGKSIFYFLDFNPLIALEIKKNRVLLSDNFINFHFNNAARFAKTLYFGKNTGDIYAICREKTFRHDSLKYLTVFEKYHAFDKVYGTNGYLILKAK